MRNLPTISVHELLIVWMLCLGVVGCSTSAVRAEAISRSMASEKTKKGNFSGVYWLRENASGSILRDRSLIIVQTDEGAICWGFLGHQSMLQLNKKPFSCVSLRSAGFSPDPNQVDKRRLLKAYYELETLVLESIYLDEPVDGEPQSQYVSRFKLSRSFDGDILKLEKVRLILDSQENEREVAGTRETQNWIRSN